MYSFDMAPQPKGGGLIEMPPVPVVPVRAGLPAYSGPAIGWPPGWAGLWTRRHAMPSVKPNFTGEPELR
jgi:hypothetical protein